MKFLQRLTLSIPVDFIHQFLEKRELDPYFKSVCDLISRKVVYDEEITTAPEPDRHHFVVFDIPEYYRADPHPFFQKWEVLSYKGSMILLSNYLDFNHFFKEKFGTKQRTELLRQNRKLHQSFEIEYTVYYGSITRTTYDRLFGQFKELLTRRFQQKGIQNDDLPHWNHYHNTFYRLVNEKKACISVMSHQQEPVCFSVNLICGKTLYGYFKSYDIDFAKYSPGSLELIRLIQWAFANQLEKFDLLKGRYPYKSKLIDQEYYFVKAVLSHKNSRISRALGLFTFYRITLFYRVVRLLKRIRVDDLFNYIRKRSYALFLPGLKPTAYKTVSVNRAFTEGELEQIIPDSPTVRSLRKPLNDFLFSTGERYQDVTLYSIPSENRCYLLRGNEHCSVVMLESK
jgi:hypothetical protein